MLQIFLKDSLMIVVVVVKAIRLGNVTFKTRACRYRDSEETEMAVREWFQVRGSDLYRDGIFKLVSRWENYTNML
jgi:hypothetical protein